MTWTDRLSSLKIRQKIIVAPLLAALAFVAIQVVDYRANKAQETLLQGISEGRFPALETSRELRETLATIQRTLQDAVAALEAFCPPGHSQPAAPSGRPGSASVPLRRVGGTRLDFAGSTGSDSSERNLVSNSRLTGPL